MKDCTGHTPQLYGLFVYDIELEVLLVVSKREGVVAFKTSLWISAI